MEPGRVAVVGRVFRILEALDGGVGDEDDRHLAAGADLVQDRDDLTPVGQRVDVALAVAAVGLFDGLHAVVVADAVPDEALGPVERIDDERVELALLVAHGLELEDEVVEARAERELRSVDFRESVLGLDEHGIRRDGGEARLADALRAVDHDAGRLRLAAFRD